VPWIASLAARRSSLRRAIDPAYTWMPDLTLRQPE
jgi:hypothetical protein